jgi:SAM-dependent methyltransferase
MGVRQSLRRLRKRRPGLWHWLSSLYLALQPVHLKELLVGTRAREKQWATRHRHRGNDWGNIGRGGDPDEWVMGYWDSRHHAHRRALVDRIASFHPFSSVLEIGCNCGPNLYLLAKRFPDAAITGIDINPRAIEKGRELLAAEGITSVKLMVARADELRRFADKSFDVVFTDATLIYVGPDKIEDVLRQLVRISRRALVLMEMQPRRRGKSDAPGVYQLGLWLRDYQALLQRFIPADRMRVSPVTEDMWTDPEWLEAGVIVEADLTRVEALSNNVSGRHTGTDVIIVCHTEIEDLVGKLAVSEESCRDEVFANVSNLTKMADRYGARVTFALCPEIAHYFPKDTGHEIGLHVHPGDTKYQQVSSGWYSGDMYLRKHTRQSSNSSVLRKYPYEEQLDMITAGKKYLEDVFGAPVKTFVAGRYSVNNDTVKALIAAGITHDCSATAHNEAGHYDWSKLPRICLPYHPGQESYQAKGSLPLLIVPISQALRSGNVNPEVVPIVGLRWLKACFREYYQQKLPLFHICLHSTSMTDPGFVATMDDFLKFISEHKEVNFRFASEIQEYGPVTPETKILPYLWLGVNTTIMSSFIKMKILRQELKVVGNW